MMHHPDLFITISEGRDRGVFSSAEIEIDDIIEISPVIVLSSEDKEKIHNTHLHDYYFLWGTKLDQIALALGYGSLYNHSNTPNATYIYEYATRTITFKCIQKIEAGDEIFIDYNEGNEKAVKLWF